MLPLKLLLGANRGLSLSLSLQELSLVERKSFRIAPIHYHKIVHQAAIYFAHSPTCSLAYLISCLDLAKLEQNLIITQNKSLRFESLSFVVQKRETETIKIVSLSNL